MSYFRNLNPYEIHKRLINEYLLNSKGSTKNISRDTSKDKRDIDVIRENHRFLWDDTPADTWEKKLAKKYYDKLFKEYCICDLSKYKENKVALRWRIEPEVINGKGQFICGNKSCTDTESLRSWEVNFSYIEDNAKKNALVKLRLCVSCSAKLNYHKKKREIKKVKKIGKHKQKETESTIPDDVSIIVETSIASTSKTHDTTKDTVLDNDAWKRGVEIEEKSREEEFESYLEDLLL